MSTPILVTGDDIVVPVTLKKNGATFVIGNGAVIKARLVRTEHEVSLCEEVIQSNAAPGTNLALSLVMVTLPSASTAGISYQGSAILEIQVDDSGKTTWFVPVSIVRGLIA